MPAFPINPTLLLTVLVAAGPATILAKDIDFSHEVVPILKVHCVECHGGAEAKGGLSLNTRPLILESGTVDVDSPEDSYLLELIRSSDPELQMPPKEKPRLKPDQIATLQRWIAAGLPWEPGFSFADSTYEPPLRPRRPDLPPTGDAGEHPIDRILDAYFARHDLEAPPPVDDATFLRRISLDLVGLLPEPEELARFVSDPNPQKREQKIHQLLENDIAYAEHWLTFFNDLLRNDYSGTGFITGGRQQISQWLYDALARNKPFDQFARELIAPPSAASQGFIDGIKWRGSVSAGQTVEIQFAQNVSQAFLGINLKCASCHDSFIDRWTLDHAYSLAAVYASEPLQIHRCDKPLDRHARAGWLFPELGEIAADAPREQRLQQLADLMTHPENGRFTRTIVNRLWYRLMGRGIVHPLDAMQTQPWSADLLDMLAVELSDNGYDLKKILALIATSQAYQSRSDVIRSETEAMDADAPFRGPRARRMTAEQFLDAVWQITGAAPDKYDAPVLRGSRDEELIADQQLTGRWIWSAETTQVPADETRVFRKQFDLDQPLDGGVAVVTCDNEFTLFINGRQVHSGDDWTDPQAVALQSRLQEGRNEIVVVAKNAGNEPNPAGLFFQALLHGADGQQVNLQSDASWEWTADIPEPREGRLGRVRGPWQSAVVLDGPATWTETIRRPVQQLLASAGEGGLPMVRAALLKNTPLMQSLGRPIRDQIVSMRPGELTTLEAIDLANNQALAETFAQGAQQLAERPWDDPEQFVTYLYRFALSRDPTDQERETLAAHFGSQPSAQEIADALWAVCMLPEFWLVR